MKIINKDRKLRRKRRVSYNLFGTKKRPRISIFRSNRYIYAQAIDDVEKKTLVSSSSFVLIKNKKINKKINKKMTKKEEARIVGLDLADKLKKIKINKGLFDRGPYHYHGRVSALIEGLRDGGIKI